MLSASLLIVIGFFLLMIGADYTIKGSVAIANKLKIAPIIIGLTILAFGTSIPEFVVSIRAALKGAEGIVLGNIIGSNIANILLILGFAAIIYPIGANKKVFLRDYSFLFIVTVLFVAICLSGMFVRWQGLLMLAVLIGFIVFNYINSKNDPVDEEQTKSQYANSPWLTVISVTILGLCVIVYGGHLLVDGAIKMAILLGVSEEIVGLTVIAFGTSLPELAVTGMAAYRKQNEVALGNIIGSNIWNIVLIMGVTATTTNVEVPKQFMQYDIWLMLASTIILLPIMLSKNKISRPEGVLFVGCYMAYIASQVMISKGIIVF